MFDRDNLVAKMIKNKILANFPTADIDIVFDENEYFISTRNKDIYYSEAYGMFILDIKMHDLWKQGIYNFYFVYDMRPHYFDEYAISFKHSGDNSYSLWNVNNTHELVVDNRTSFNDYSLAA